MHPRYRAPIFAAILGLGLAGSTAAAAAPPRVLASIKPIDALVAAVMEGVGAPDLLVGGALSEHTYELKPSDAEKVALADIIVWVGPDLETFLITPVETLGKHATVLTLERAPGVRLLPARRGGLWGAGDDDSAATDPHIWLDPVNAMAMTEAIAQTLAKADPADAARYRTNAARYIARLKILNAALQKQLAPLKGRPFIVFHDAYHYFDTRYGLSAVGSVTVAPDRPVGPRRIAALRRAVQNHRATCLFREPQFPPKLVVTIAEGTSVRVGVLDPLGADLAPGPALYPTVLQRLADSLSRCLGKKP